MSIQVVCPNGHQLVVRARLAGRIGVCPLCKAEIRIPQLSNGNVTEDDILDFLGPCNPGPKPHRQELDDDWPPAKSGTRRRVDGPSPPMKSCEKCNREIEVGTHICPHCHTYIAGLSDV
jgi:hypothetical protein